MSLLIAYHDARRAVVCSDDRAVTLDESGARIPMNVRVPKFLVFLGLGLVVGAVGRVDLSGKLWDGTKRLVTANPTVGFGELTQIVPGVSRMAFERRQPLQFTEADKFDVALVGYDRHQGRIRSFAWRSPAFEPVET